MTEPVRRDDDEPRDNDVGTVARRVEDRYGLVIVLLILTFMAVAMAGSPAGLAFAAIMLALTLFSTLRASNWQSRSRRVVIAIALVTIAAVAVASAVGGRDTGAGVVFSVMLVFVLTAMYAIARRVRQQPTITMKTVAGALAFYLYFGLLFTLVFALINAIATAPFFAQTSHPSTLDFIYFSLVTLTTTGYGDYTAALGAGRMLAVTEALLGQLYLVSVVALFVGNIGKPRAQ